MNFASLVSEGFIEDPVIRDPERINKTWLSVA
jgi:hypothetical protein